MMRNRSSWPTDWVKRLIKSLLFNKPVWLLLFVCLLWKKREKTIANYYIITIPDAKWQCDHYVCLSVRWTRKHEHIILQWVKVCSSSVCLLWRKREMMYDNTHEQTRYQSYVTNEHALWCLGLSVWSNTVIDWSSWVMSSYNNIDI